jgi:protein Mpv17
LPHPLRSASPPFPSPTPPFPRSHPQSNPILVKTLTSAALFGLGDFMSQKLEKKESLDTARLVRLTAWGGMFAPLAHKWYGMLDKMVPGTGPIVLAKKVAADQVRLESAAVSCASGIRWGGKCPSSHLSLSRVSCARVSPPFCARPPQFTWTIFINCGFFFATSFMETGDPTVGITQIKEKLWPTLKVNWVVWPVLQGVNFSLVPEPYRLLYINFCSLFWSAYLSNMAAAKPAAPDALK